MNLLHFKDNASNRDVISLFQGQWGWILAFQKLASTS